MKGRCLFNLSNVLRSLAELFKNDEGLDETKSLDG